MSENSRDVTAGITSPRISLVFGPWDMTETFVNAGYGFHSNDARGVTIKVDPAIGGPVDAATTLVRSTGAELGLRTAAIRNLQASLSLWVLKLDSERVCVGDAGSTEAGRPSQRCGVERCNRWRLLPWMLLDPDLARNPVRFTGDASEADYVPGAPDAVVSAGLSVPRYGPWSGALFMRYIDSYPLTEDNRVRSDAQTVFEAQLSDELARNLQLRLDVFNLFNAETSDISYYDESRQPGEPPEGVADRHVHPGQPRSVRVSLSLRF